MNPRVLRGQGFEYDAVAEGLELGEGSLTLALGVAPDEVVATKVLIVQSSVSRCQAMTRIECPTATAALFLPIRRASRQYWADRSVSRLLAAAQAHSMSTSPSQRLPLVGLPERRLPPVRLLPGQRPAHEARWPAVGTRSCRRRFRR